MVSLIKNQILKHLSRFTKNLSPDKINVSTFKGEGELSSLELDEIILTDLLELPSWVRLTSAWCNKVSFRIQWTKLKSVPISIFLDEVNVEIETCEELRSLSAQQGLSSYSAPTKYNFINKVIDGMTINVNVVSITFRTPAFIASVQIMRIVVESKTPNWKRAELNKTRLKDSARGQILIFKGLEWQTLRLEARSTKDIDLPPLRLLTNKANCRLTIKKRLSDCFVMGCKLLLRLDDLLWVLTDSQLKAVLHFVESLSGLVQKANETTRIKKAARKLEMLPEYHAQVSQQARGTEPSSKEQVFARFDVIETSYHFIAQKIVLHLSDDPGAGRSCHPLLQNGSAVCLKLCSLQIDYYPYHLSAADRNHWGRYDQENSLHLQWLNAAQNSFKNSLLQLIDISNKKSTQKSSENKKEEEYMSFEKNYESLPSSHSVKKYVIDNLAKVMTSCVVIRVEDFTMYKVTTVTKQTPKEFIKGDKERYSFPTDVSLHAEFTYYYYPGDIAFPLPSPKFYVQINPVYINFDLLTVLWLNSFALNLHQSLVNTKQESAALNYIDVKIEAIMPRLIFESNNENQYGQRDRPKSLQFQVSRALLSNVRSVDCCSRSDLAKCLYASELGSLFYGSEFPVKNGDLVVVSKKFLDHVDGKDHVRSLVETLPTGSIAEFVNALSKTLLWTEARDVWCINLEPLWGDFYGARGIAHNRPVAFLDTFPLKIWLHMDGPKNDINALAYISNLISIQINHYQLLFLLRLADEMTELVTMLEMDAERIKHEKSGNLVVGAVIPQVEVTLVMPSQTPGKESSGADLESVIPDTSSLADDIVTNPSIQWNTVLTTNLQDGAVYKRENTVSATSPPSDQISIDLASPIKLDSPKSNLNSLMGLSSVKKGFTNFSKMIDSALKPFPDDAVSDTISIRSDGSSDSDNSVINKLSLGDDMFNVDGNEALSEGVDIGSEAFEEDNQSGTTMSATTASESHSNASSYKRRDLISVATFKLGQVEVVQQSKGLESVIKAQISNVAVEECAAIPWDEFQNKFNARSRGWTEVCDQPAERPRIRLRKEHSVTLGDLKTWPGPRNNTWFSDMLTVSLANITLSMNISTLSSIAEFSVDDAVSPCLPIQLNLEDLEFSIIDDRPSLQGGSNNPSFIQISKLRVFRTKEGAINVEPPETEKSNLVSSEEVSLKLENEQLRRRLTAMERLNEENHRLRKCEEEAQLLRSCLNDAQETLNSLLQEKQNLLEIIKNVQQSKGENKQQTSGKR
ncbi:bridge-like lipid transfer protein family member 3B [Halyomorpha halys]|uniref:bridge-like lipid transfer protein family member 3B n=1 Tax=Halyomorpha halys TaxID=286706 RepID=UPI0006D4E670|nr:UHRF1-binding protein 1-like [Halyomorpha halys]